MRVTPRTEVNLKVVSNLEDRSDLSDEMASLCAKLPIYQVAEGEVDLSGFNQTNDVVEMPDVVQSPAKRKWNTDTFVSFNHYVFHINCCSARCLLKK